ncbi:MAG TPA: hypothetical protein VN112_09645 [Ensifer sp.]|nr:hypothetical protein [Ensifer sp.]
MALEQMLPQADNAFADCLFPEAANILYLMSEMEARFASRKTAPFLSEFFGEFFERTHPFEIFVRKWIRVWRMRSLFSGTISLEWETVPETAP